MDNKVIPFRKKKKPVKNKIKETLNSPPKDELTIYLLMLLLAVLLSFVVFGLK